MELGILAKAKQKRQEKFNNEFISLFDSVIYLGEPLEQALEYIVELAPTQSKLYLTSNGCENVTVYTDVDFETECEYRKSDFNNSIWRFGSDGIYGKALNFYQIVEHLTECIKQKHIEPTNPIYNLGFGKKRFLSCLQSDGITLRDPKDLENAISPTPIFDEYSEWDNMDYYTVQSIIDERDELREKLNSQQTAKENKSELATKSKNAIAKIILALLEINELDWQNADPYDYTSPNSINNLIYSQLQALNLEVSNRFIGDWIKLAQEQAQ